MRAPYAVGEERQGDQIGFPQRYNQWVDTAFKPLSVPTGALGRLVGRGVDALAKPENPTLWEDALGTTLEHAPRMFAQMALALRKGSGVKGKVAGFGDIAMQSYAQQPEDVSFPRKLAATGLHTGAFAAMPAVGKIGAGLATPYSRQLGDKIASPALARLVERGVEKGAALTAVMGTFEAANAVAMGVVGESYLDAIKSPEYQAALVASTLPFEVPQLPSLMRGYKVNEKGQLDPVGFKEMFSKNIDRQVGSLAEFNRMQEILTRVKVETAVRNLETTMERETSPDGPQTMWLKDQLQGDTFGMIAQEVFNEPMNYKLPIDKQGMFSGKPLFNRLRTLLPTMEFEVLKDAGLEKFLTDNPKVTRQEMLEFVRENGIKVQVHKIEAGDVDSANQRMADTAHEIDGLVGGRRWNVDNIETLNLDPDVKVRVEGLIEEYNKASAELSRFNLSEYNNYIPENAEHVAIVVTLPIKKKTGEVMTPREIEDSSSAVDLGSRLYSSGHMGPYGENAIGWVRGYLKTMPDGSKLFHSFELQSDFAQDISKARKAIKEGDVRAESEGLSFRSGNFEIFIHKDDIAMGKGDYFKTQEGVAEARARAGELAEKYIGATTSKAKALIRDYETILLKATIDQAIKLGAKKVALSDPETVLLTEGHDRAARSVLNPTPENIKVLERLIAQSYTKESQLSSILEPIKSAFDNGKSISVIELSRISAGMSAELLTAIQNAGFKPSREIKQAKGMRASYGEKLPSIMERITGYKGERVTLGEHKQTQGREDLIVENPDGTLKRDITALAYPLDKVVKRLQERGGFPFSGKAFVLDQVAKDTLAKLEMDGVSPETLASVVEAFKIMSRRPGESLVDYYARSIGIDPKVNRSNDPQTLLRSFKDYITWKFGEVMGMPKDQLDSLMPMALKVAEILGHTQGETRVLPAEGGASFYMPSRGNLPNAFIGLAHKGTGNMARDFYTALHTLAHELTHGIAQQIEGKTAGRASPEMVESWQKAFAMAEKLSTSDMGETLMMTMKSIAPEGAAELLSYRKDFYPETAVGRHEFLADMTAAITVAAVSPKKGRFQFAEDVIRFAPQEVRGLMTSLYRTMAQAFNAVVEYGKKLFGWRKETTSLGEQVQENLRKLLKANDEADAAVEAFMLHDALRTAEPYSPVKGIDYARAERLFEMANKENEGWDPELLKFVQEESHKVVPQADYTPVGLGERLHWWDKLKAMPQLVRDFPQMVDTARLGRNWFGMVSEATMKMWEHMVDPVTKKYDIEGFQRLIKEDTDVNKAFSAVALRQQDPGLNGQRLTAAQKTGIPEYAKLNEVDKAFIDQKLDQVSAAVMAGAAMRTEGYRANIGHHAATVLMSHDRSMRWDQADKLGRALVDLFLEPDRKTDPVLQRREAEALEVVKTYENTEVLKNAVDLVQELIPTFQRTRTQLMGEWREDSGSFGGRPGYLPEVRLGRYHIAYKQKGKEPSYIAFKDKADFDKRLASLNERNQKGELEFLKVFDKEDQSDRYKGLQPDMLSTLAEADAVLLNKVINKLSQTHPESQEWVKELREEFQPGQGAAGLVESPYMKNRRLYGGREELNIAAGVLHYVNSTAHGTSKMFAKGQRRLVLNDPGLVANPNLRGEARKYLSEILDPKGRELTGLKNLAFFHFLGFNPSQFFVEMTQQFVTHVPALLNQGMGFGEAYRETFKALKDSYRGQWVTKGEYGNAEETRAMREAVEKNIADKGWVQELFHLEEDVPFINSRNMLTGKGSVLNKEQVVGNALYHTLKLARNFYSLSVAWNTRAAFLSSFRMYKRQGKSYEEAFKLSDDLSRESMFGGGKASRPLFFLTGPLGSTVGGVMYILQSYTYNAIAQQARYLQRAIKGTNLTQQERRAAGRAAGAAIMSQVALGGILGLPFASQIFALIEQLFPDSEPKKELRKVFTGLFEDNEKLGHFVADAAMDGLFNSATPLDMSARFQLGGLMGVDPYGGFSWANVVGASADMLERFFQAPQMVSEGRYGDAATQFLPGVPRRAVRLAADGWDVRNKDGRLDVELSKTEAGLYGLGFMPKRVSQHRKLNSMKMRSEQVASREQKRFHQELAQAYREGKVSEVRGALTRRGFETEGYDAAEGARRVAELILEQTLPFDPVRSTSRVGQPYNAQKLYPRYPIGVSESERLRMRQRIVESLGVRAPMTRTSEREASAVDQLMQANPSMSRAEAKEMLRRAMGQR
jgi:hypothetical protein